MGIWDKIKNKEYEEEDDAYEQEPAEPAAVKPAAPAHTQRAAGASALELKVVRPETYDAAGKIADHLLNRCTVVLNLEATNKETARRLVDFLTGVAYSISGSIRRVATNTFVITPSNVGISGENTEAPEAPKTAAKADEADDFAF